MDEVVANNSTAGVSSAVEPLSSGPATSTPDNRLSTRGPVSAETKSGDKGEGTAAGEVSLFNMVRTKKSNRNRVSIIFTMDIKS